MIELVTAQRTSTAPAGRFFAKWIDHASWAEWSPDSEWARVDGPVTAGARGRLKPKGGPATKFVVTVCEADREYTDVTKLPGARLTFQHTAEAAGDGTRLRVRIWIEGPLARLWARILGSGFRDSAPADLDRLVAIAERG